MICLVSCPDIQNTACVQKPITYCCIRSSCGRLGFLCRDSDYVWDSAVFMPRLGLCLGQCSFYVETRIIFCAVQFLCVDSDYFRHSAVFMQILRLFLTQCSFYAESRIVFGAVQFLCLDLDYFRHSAVFKQSRESCQGRHIDVYD